MSNDVINIGDINKKLELERDEARKQVEEWERWLKELLIDFRIPFDASKDRMRSVLANYMADRNADVALLFSENIKMKDKLDMVYKFLSENK
jgi:hypothetical protein